MFLQTRANPYTSPSITVVLLQIPLYQSSVIDVIPRADNTGNKHYRFNDQLDNALMDCVFECI